MRLSFLIATGLLVASAAPSWAHHRHGEHRWQERSCPPQSYSQSYSNSYYGNAAARAYGMSGPNSWGAFAPSMAPAAGAFAPSSLPAAGAFSTGYSSNNDGYGNSCCQGGVQPAYVPPVWPLPTVDANNAYGQAQYQVTQNVSGGNDLGSTSLGAPQAYTSPYIAYPTPYYYGTYSGGQTGWIVYPPYGGYPGITGVQATGGYGNGVYPYGSAGYSGYPATGTGVVGIQMPGTPNSLQLGTTNGGIPPVGMGLLAPRH